MATGRLTLMPFAIVTDLVYDRDRKRASGVRVMDAVTEQTTEYSAPIVFLCASTINSTWMLMRSATDVWPGGLGSSRGELGHNLMDHHFRFGAKGVIHELRRPQRLRAAARPASTFRAIETSSATSASYSPRLWLPGQRESRGVGACGARTRCRRRLQGRRWRNQAPGASARRRSARCCPVTTTGSPLTRRAPTTGVSRCWRSIARSARTNT